ncbi:MAG: tetratricopeptide repeat protein [candidate division Zixibacteria bacterium]
MITTHTKRIGTAITLAVLFIGLSLSGCVTKRDIEDIKDQLTRVEMQSRESSRVVASVDSLISHTAEANEGLRADVRTSVKDLGQQVSSLLEAYNEIVRQLAEMRSDLQSRGVLRGSPGASGNMPARIEPEPVKSGPNCDSLYDDAFTLAVQEEFDPAIGKFRDFLADCATDQRLSDAYYWIGECYFRQKKYDRAASEFNHLVATFTSSPKFVPALFKLARCKQETDKAGEAKTLYQQIVDEHQGTLEATHAANRLKELN